MCGGKGHGGAIRESLLKIGLMVGQVEKVQDCPVTTRLPDQDCSTTPVTDKYLCAIIKASISDLFTITTYFTDTIKRDTLLWKKK